MSRAHEVVHDRLWMSATPAKWRPGTFDAFLHDQHIEHVVALCNRPPTSEGWEGTGFTTIHHMPVKDSHKTVAPEIPQVVVPKVVSWVRAGERTLVSCLVGRSRSGITCGLVIRELFGLTGEQALEQLRAGRPNAIKREGPEAWLRSLPSPSEDRWPTSEFGPPVGVGASE